jgi:hypothetical protein
VDDIAERAKPDDQDAPHLSDLSDLSYLPHLPYPPLIRDSRSRVAWSLASPTIAVRPPYASTIARSGTVSTV